MRPQVIFVSVPIHETTPAIDRSVSACFACSHDAPRIELQQDGTGARIGLCPRCLRASLRMQADGHDRSGTVLLQDYAETYGWQVWRSDHAAYLFPTTPSSRR